MIKEELEFTVIQLMDRFTTMNLACSLNNGPWTVPVYYVRQRVP